VTFGKDQVPPVRGFWSLTLYNEHHFFQPNEIKNSAGAFVLAGDAGPMGRKLQPDFFPGGGGGAGVGVTG